MFKDKPHRSFYRFGDVSLAFVVQVGKVPNGEFRQSPINRPNVNLRYEFVCYLVKCAQEEIFPCQPINSKLSHQDLANIIGSTRETVTVVLGELQAEGKVTLGRRRIVLTDPAALAASVNEPVREMAISR